MGEWKSPPGTHEKKIRSCAENPRTGPGHKLVITPFFSTAFDSPNEEWTRRSEG